MHMAEPIVVTATVKRLPSSKRNTPPPATFGKKRWSAPEQASENCGAAGSACSSRKVNDPNVPSPATFSDLKYAPSRHVWEKKVVCPGTSVGKLRGCWVSV